MTHFPRRNDTPRHGRWTAVPAVFLALLPLALALLGGCETADYTGVTFKPKDPEATAHRTALTMYLYRPSEREVAWGNPSMTHQEFFLGDRHGPLAEHEVWLDGLSRRSDGDGRIDVKGLAPGHHALFTELLGTRFEGLVPVEKGRRTLLLLDLLRPDQAWWWMSLPPHDFVVAPDVRRLAVEGETLRAFLLRYVAARASADPDALAPLVSPRYRDAMGDGGDWLKAMCASPARPRPAIRQVWCVVGNDEATLEWSGLGPFPGRKGRRFQERLLLVREGQPPRWRVRAQWD